MPGVGLNTILFVKAYQETMIESFLEHQTSKLLMLGNDLMGICKNILMIEFVRKVKVVSLLVVILEGVAGLIMHIA